MNAAAVEVVQDIPELCIAYGISDEYRFAAVSPASSGNKPADRVQLRLSSKLPVIRAPGLVGHRTPVHGGVRLAKDARKLVTTIASTFTAYYIYYWDTYFPSTPLQPPHLPSFDGRAVLYPATRNLRDYMSWRQVDCISPPSVCSAPDSGLLLSRPH